jgi:hypothetical protein
LSFPDHACGSALGSHDTPASHEWQAREVKLIRTLAAVTLALLITSPVEAQMGSVAPQQKGPSAKVEDPWKDIDHWSDTFTGAEYWDAELFGRSKWDGHGVGLTVRKVVMNERADTSYLLIAHREEADWAFFEGLRNG